MRHVLYNPLAHNKEGEKIAKDFVARVHLDKDSSQYALRDITKTDCRFLLDSLYPGDEVFIVGGGGTIMRFAQSVQDMELQNDIFFAPSGVGNDFFNDISQPGDNYARVNDYIKRIHYATINDKKYPFLTDVGLGIDGYSCSLGESARVKDKNFNYSMAVVKGVLGKYKPCGCSIIVDGKDEEYFDDVWMASTMAGTSYGGGVKIAPTYDRLKADYLELIIFSCPNTAKALMNFPAIINGTHENNGKGTKVFRGKKIEIYFMQPRDAQIDGEPIPNVQKYVAEF